MEKAKVSKEVFEALEQLKIKNGDLQKDIVNYIEKYREDKWRAERYKPLNSIDLDKFMKCAFYGYELEETTEQKILKLYEYYNEENLYFSSGVRFAIEEVLKYQGLVIEGINKEV